MAHCRKIHAVIKESLRIYPPLIGLSRVAAEDCVVNGYHVPKGTMFSLLTLATHKSPAFFDEPEIFKPERWLGTDDNSTKLNYAWFPFGSGTIFLRKIPRINFKVVYCITIGTRSCVGNNFSLLQMKCWLAMVLKVFKFSVVNEVLVICSQRLQLTRYYSEVEISASCGIETSGQFQN